MGGWLSPSMTQNSAGCFCSCRRCWTFAQHVSDCFQIWFGCAQNACFNLRTKIYAWKHVKASGLGWFTVVVFAMVSRFVSIVLILVNSKTCVEPGKSYLMPCQFFKILTSLLGFVFHMAPFARQRWNVPWLATIFSSVSVCFWKIIYAGFVRNLLTSTFHHYWVGTHLLLCSEIHWLWFVFSKFEQMKHLEVFVWWIPGAPSLCI